MAFVTLFIFVIWMYQVRLLIALILGINASFSSLRQFITIVLTANEGLLFLAIGNAVGAALSLILFSLTVVSFPLLLDRDVDFATAMVTSVRAVVTSPVPMIGWGAIIVVLLIVSSIPYFLGLLVTLPVLGHATSTAASSRRCRLSSEIGPSWFETTRCVGGLLTIRGSGFDDAASQLDPHGEGGA
jgi:uncharacterized membrane protein